MIATCMVMVLPGCSASDRRRAPALLLMMQRYASCYALVNSSLWRANMAARTNEPARAAEIARRRLLVGRQVRRWRMERGLTLAVVADRSGLNVGYLSQIENDKASPSLGCLA